LAQKRSTMSPENPFILASKGQAFRTRGAKNRSGVGFCNLVTKHANPCGAVTTWVVWANTRLITCFGFLVDLFTGFCGSPPARYGGSILTIYTSYDVLPHIATQTDAFWGGVDTASHLDRRHTCDFIARFCRATIARQNRNVMNIMLRRRALNSLLRRNISTNKFWAPQSIRTPLLTNRRTIIVGQ